MILATTTSTQDSGLLDELVPRFQDDSGCSVKTIAVGSGEALELGEKGDADVLLVHSPEAEEEYMDGGHGVSRKAVMHNDFIVVGPADDPAHVKGAGSAAEAFTGIAKAEAPFASRADESGTNTKELSLWEAAGIEPKGSWYIETGQGMGETLTIASQKQAYTLSDRGTFLATDNLDLDLLVEGGKDLLNPYHVIVVKGERREPRLRAGVLRLDHLPGDPGRDREVRRHRVRRAALRPRREGLMDTVHEVLGRSALVSLTATAIALALGVPVGHLARARASQGSRRARHRSQYRHGDPDGRRRAGRRPAALAKRTARRPGADLHPARDDHRPGSDRRPADRRDHDGGASGAPGGAARPAPGARREHASARRRLWIEARVPLLAAAMAGFGHAISEVGAATIVGGNIHGQTQVMTTSIVEQVGKGDFNEALVYAAILLALAFTINAVLTSVQQRAAAWAQS